MMADRIANDDPSSWPSNRLANNAMTVIALRSALQGGSTGLESVPRRLIETIRDEAWKAWKPGGIDRPYRCADFRRFLTGPRAEGCCETPVWERIVKDTEAWVPYCDQLAGEPGGQLENKNAQKTNADNVRNRFEPAIIPMPGGNASITAIRRLSRERPDLLVRVRIGELTPHGAMVIAGFRKHTITVPADPEGAARRLRRHFDGDRLKQLIELLAR